MQVQAYRAATFLSVSIASALFAGEGWSEPVKKRARARASLNIAAPSRPTEGTRSTTTNLVIAQQETPPSSPQSIPPAPAAPLPTPAPSEPTTAAPTTPALPTPETGKPTEKHPKSFWDRMKLRGYAQLRYNRLLESNPKLVNPQGDRSIGPLNGFLLRRARLILQGDVHDHLSIYLQPDFASVINDQYHVAIMRDWYADIFLDSARNFRFRVGQSKVPYGFENMQSSQNRIPFDRSDALNSAVKDERDIGVFFYWETTEAREHFKKLVDDGLKGSGDYGIVGLGVYNGQTANRPELNDNLHVVARVSYPFLVGSQFVEVGVQGYTGRFVVKKDTGVTGGTNFLDRRAAISFTLYPQPFGIQAEYNIGEGPQYEGGVVNQGFLHGGYVLASYRLGRVFPYARGVIYDGGKKFENNAPKYHVRELELGVEWEVMKAVELTGAFMLAKRTYPVIPYPLEEGRLFRLQLQFSY